MPAHPRQNPYQRYGGQVPPLMAGRSEQLRRFHEALDQLSLGTPTACILFCGPRGVGKSVLLQECRASADKQGIIVSRAIDPLPFGGPERIERELHDVLKRTPRGRYLRWRLGRLAPRVNMVTLGVIGTQVGVGTDRGQEAEVEPWEDVAPLLIRVGEGAARTGRGAMLVIDEFQHLPAPAVQALTAALRECAQRTLPVTIAGAGLGSTKEHVQEATGAAHAVFSFVDVGKLTGGEAVRAIVEPARTHGVTFDEDAAAELADRADGHPSLLQLYAWFAWDKGDVATGRIDVKAAHLGYSAARRHLDEHLFEPTVSALPPVERAFVLELAACDAPEHPEAPITQAVTRRFASVVGAAEPRFVADRLVRKDILERRGGGNLVFAIAGLREYVRGSSWMDWLAAQEAGPPQTA